MKDIKYFIDLVKDKNILYIPIVSCINRDTQEYNLSSDGNVNRFITTFSYANGFKNLTIFLPSKHIVGSECFINKFCELNNNVKIKYSDNFGIHAGEQRNNDYITDSILNELNEYINNDTIIIFESQLLGLKISKKYNNNLIFWNPVSETNDKTRDFLCGYKEINDNCLNFSDYMIVASPDQYNYFNNSEKIIMIDKLIDRDLSIFEYQKNDVYEKILEDISKDTTIFYLPYRLTDEGYKFNNVIKYIKGYCNNKFNKVTILYSDPNNSHIIDNLSISDEFKSRFFKVPTDRNTYYTILDSNVYKIIPYFEDIEFINHASIDEFKMAKNVMVVLYNQNNNPYNVLNNKNFKNINSYEY